jgi:hypothetical protein
LRAEQVPVITLRREGIPANGVPFIITKEVFRDENKCVEKDISANQEDDLGRDQKPQAPESGVDNGILQSHDTAVSGIFGYCRDLPEREQFDDTDTKFRY